MILLVKVSSIYPQYSFMSQKLQSLVENNAILNLIGKIADQEKLEAYVIGGVVRDFLLYGHYKNDLDIVVIGSGIQLASKVKTALGNESNLTVYKNFGTAAISYQDQAIEFVGARKESYRSESRKPIVEDGTLEDDQNRRDFTVNALAIALNKDRKGELLDPFDGISDLKRKLIRTPLDPSLTFSDDPLRIMRGIRFAAQHQFDIDPDTFQGMETMKERLSIVSKERITDELNKIIASDQPSYGFKLLFSTGVLQLIFPEMHKLQGIQKREGRAHKDNFYHTLQVLDNTAAVSDNLWLRWAAVLHDIAKPATQRFHPKSGWTFHGHEDLGAKWVPRIFKRLKLPLNEKMKYVQKLVKLHLRPIALVKEEVTDAAIRRLLFEAGNDIDDLMTLCRADITSKNHSKVKRYLSNFELVENKLREVEEKDHIRNFSLPITGDEIMAVYGIKPGRIIGEVKNAIKEAILDGHIPNEREAAIQMMMELMSERGLHPVS
jgi:poly(A) polymerase